MSTDRNNLRRYDIFQKRRCPFFWRLWGLFMGDITRIRQEAYFYLEKPVKLFLKFFPLGGKQLQ